MQLWDTPFSKKPEQIDRPNAVFTPNHSYSELGKAKFEISGGVFGF